MIPHLQPRWMPVKDFEDYLNECYPPYNMPPPVTKGEIEFGAFMKNTNAVEEAANALCKIKCDADVEKYLLE